MDYWNTYLWRDAVRRIITINTIVWIVMALWLFFWGSSVNVDAIAPDVFAVSSNPGRFLRHCWTAVTYMWVQYDFLHLLANMLWLMLFGDLLVGIIGPKRLVTVYILGGLCGALGYVLYHLVFAGSTACMVGASCAVLAVSGVAAMLMPQWRVNLLLLGQVKIIWIVVAAIVLFVFIQPSLDVSVAHAAGLGLGLVYGALKKRGIDIADPFVVAYDRLTSRRRTDKTWRYDQRANADEEQEFDRLLAKVSRSGYSSLSSAERQRLFNLSQKVKK